MSASARPLRIALVAGEASGDALGASLIEAFGRGDGPMPSFIGVGGERMAEHGFASLFPQHEIAVNGILPVLKRLPTLFRRMRDTAKHIVAEQPDVLVTIDSPDFSLRVAKRVRAAAPHIPIVHWVCPSVWAWRPGRARAMLPYVDRILCLLPFEPHELLQLHGPEGVYVGHPLIERLDVLRPGSNNAGKAEAQERQSIEQPLVLLLPGSRGSEISRLMPVMGEAAARVAAALPGARFVLPAVPHLLPRIQEAVAGWRVPVDIIVGETAKLSAFRRARAALAASGTVTLELALAAVPTVACYRVSPPEAALARRLLRIPTVILPNLALGQNAVPELLQQDATPEAMARKLLDIIADDAPRQAQLDAFARLEDVMRLADTARPSEAARDAILTCVDTVGANKKRGT
ncbi:MAG: lipid-A-disaccharide synthase [Bosea sp. (in: a-proteobacteria)]